MILRKYEEERDKEAVEDIWYEVGWFRREPRQRESLELMLKGARPLVAEVDGRAEGLVLTSVGDMLYLQDRIAFADVLSVATSRVVRRMGVARRVTARAVAEEAAAGAAVAALSIFDQGFYNQLGFGNGSYIHWASIDPAFLRVPARARPPKRLGVEQWQDIHANRLARWRRHGSVSVYAPEITRSELLQKEHGFGLGYFDGPDGSLSHHVWMVAEGGTGPYNVLWMCYQSGEQFLELLALIQELSDQVRVLRLLEPAGFHLQDFIHRPFRMLSSSYHAHSGGAHQMGIWARAPFQWRMCSLERCLAGTHLKDGPVRFNVRIHDPIQSYLDADAPWRGVAGDYVVTLGRESQAEKGVDASLPTMEASVGAFTRLWLGILPATSLAVADDLTAPPHLLEELENVLNLPPMQVDWDL